MWYLLSELLCWLSSQQDEGCCIHKMLPLGCKDNKKVNIYKIISLRFQNIQYFWHPHQVSARPTFFSRNSNATNGFSMKIVISFAKMVLWSWHNNLNIIYFLNIKPLNIALRARVCIQTKKVKALRVKLEQVGPKHCLET